MSTIFQKDIDFADAPPPRNIAMASWLVLLLPLSSSPTFPNPATIHLHAAAWVTP